VLFSNRKIAIEKPAIVDVAPTILKLFGLELPAYFDGKPWAVAPSVARAPSPAMDPSVPAT
jgi:hypothetical protein